MAMLAHVLQLFGAFIAPLIIFLVKRDSKFVRYHALQPLIWQGIIFVLSFVLMLGFMMTMFLTMPVEAQGNANQPPPTAFFVMFGGVWILIMGSWVVNLFLAIYHGIKANEGTWSRYPLIWRLAARWA
jgi:uncharacterized protein